jgi:hypothetical protein
MKFKMTERKIPVPQNALGCAIACITFPKIGDPEA